MSNRRSTNWSKLKCVRSTCKTKPNWPNWQNHFQWLKLHLDFGVNFSGQPDYFISCANKNTHTTCGTVSQQNCPTFLCSFWHHSRMDHCFLSFELSEHPGRLTNVCSLRILKIVIHNLQLCFFGCFALLSTDLFVHHQYMNHALILMKKKYSSQKKWWITLDLD